MCKDTQAFEPEKDEEYRAMLDMVPGDSGSVLSQGRIDPATVHVLKGKNGKMPFRVQRSSVR